MSSPLSTGQRQKYQFAVCPLESALEASRLAKWCTCGKETWCSHGTVRREKANAQLSTWASTLAMGLSPA